MYKLLLTLLILPGLVGISQAQEKKVRYSLAAYTQGTTTRLSSIKAGGSFDLAMYVQDLRPANTYVDPVTGETKDCLRGVWAAYADIMLSKAFFQVVTQPSSSYVTSFKFSKPYVNGKHATAETFGIGALGAFDGFDPIGSDLLEVTRCTIKAQWPASMTTGTQYSALIYPRLTQLAHPFYDTLVLGNLVADPPEQSDVSLDQMIVSGVTVTIIK